MCAFNYNSLVLGTILRTSVINSNKFHLCSHLKAKRRKIFCFSLEFTSCGTRKVMLSFTSSRAGAGIVLKYIRLSEVSAALASSNCCTKNVDKPSQVESRRPADQFQQSHPLYKRDLVNFPRPERLETNPPVRFGIIPKYWFDFFYEKTGFTGGYMLLFGGLVVLFSKEIIVINSEMMQAFAYPTLMVIIHKTYGKSIRNYIEKKQENEEEEIDGYQDREKSRIRNQIKYSEKTLWSAEGVATLLPEAKRENVYLQMELAYRERLQAQYLAVKNILDYQVQKSNIERLALQKAVASWIINSVNQSITPEIKHDALRKSIEDLQDLAMRNAV